MGKGQQPIEGMPLVQRHSRGLGTIPWGDWSALSASLRIILIWKAGAWWEQTHQRCIEANTYEWTEGVWAEAGRENFQTRWLIWHLGKKEKEDQVGRASDQHSPEKTSARLIEGPQAEWPIEAGMGSCWHPYHALSLAEYCLVWKHSFPHNSLASSFCWSVFLFQISSCWSSQTIPFFFCIFSLTKFNENVRALNIIYILMISKFISPVQTLPLSFSLTHTAAYLDV